MLCAENGVLPGSHYFFFVPSEFFQEHYFYLLNCGRFSCGNGYHIKRNGYISPLIIYIKSGSLFLNYEGKHYTAGKDEVLLIDCDNPHEYLCKSECEFFYFHYSGSNSAQITGHLIAQNGGAVFRLKNSRNIGAIMENVLTRLCKGEHLSDSDLSCAVYNTICSIQLMNEILPVASSPASHTITGVINFMKANIAESFTLDLLAKRADLSKYYFLHLFKKETGLTPMEYIAQLRINLAKNILKTTTRTIEDIAESLGYSSGAGFINAFTKKTGISPGKYRHAPVKFDKVEPAASV